MEHLKSDLITYYNQQSSVYKFIWTLFDSVVLRNGEVAGCTDPIDCHIPMRFTQWYRFPRHLEEMCFFWNVCPVTMHYEISRAKIFHALRPYIRKTQLVRGSYSLCRLRIYINWPLPLEGWA